MSSLSDTFTLSEGKKVLILPESQQLSSGLQKNVRSFLYRKTFEIIGKGYHEPTAVMVLSFAIDFWSRVCRTGHNVLSAWSDETDSCLTARKVGLALLRMGFKHCSSFDSSGEILKYLDLLRISRKLRGDVFLAECLLLEHIGPVTGDGRPASQGSTPVAPVAASASDIRRFLQTEVPEIAHCLDLRNVDDEA
eukprot:s726_g14.t1